MKGIVEIYQVYPDGSEQFILSEDNLIVDGARATLTEMLTIPPYVSGVASASSILDVSNWSPRALSFGKDALSFSSNLHRLNQNVSGFTVTGLTVSGPYFFTLNAGTNATRSWISINGLPKAPTPMDVLLEENLPIPSSFGQCANWINFSSTYGLTSSQAIASGCFAPSGGINLILSTYTGATAPTKFNVAGAYNLKGNMDYRGYVRWVSGTDPSGALITSSNSNSSSLREVIYITQINTADMNLLALYGGIYTLGLWSIDVKETLKYLTPPFIWNPATNLIKYRLFAKKSFSYDLVQAVRYISTTSPTTDLKIVWRLFL